MRNVDTLLGNNHEISNYTTVIDGQRLRRNHVVTTNTNCELLLLKAGSQGRERPPLEADTEQQLIKM
jgi:hypothetical protein